MDKVQKNAIARIQKLYPGKFNIKTLKWRGYGKPFTIACKKHGEFETTSTLVKYHHKNGDSPCPYCNTIIKFDEEIVTEELNSLIWNQHLRITGFTKERATDGNNYYCANITCICSHEFSRPIRVIRSKDFRGCPKCNRQRPRITDNASFMARVKETGNPNLMFPNLNWTSSSDIIKGYCMKHRLRVEARHPAYLKYQVCPRCTEDKRLVTQESHRKIKELFIAKKQKGQPDE